MDNFYTDTIRKDARFTTTRVVTDVSLLEPGFRAAVAALIVDAHAAGHVIEIGETYRSQDRQRQLFDLKLTQLRDVGVHGYGLAADFRMLVNGKYDPKGEDYAFLTGLCKKHGLISGADWGTPCERHTFRDWDHVQRIPVFRQADLFAGKWYPPVNYDPWADQTAHNIK